MSEVYMQNTNLHSHLFATRKDYDTYCQLEPNAKTNIINNKIYQNNTFVANVISKQDIHDLICTLNKMSLDPLRTMPSPGWRFEIFKNPNGTLDYEFTKAEWLRRTYDYVGIHFTIGNAFERAGAAPLVSYFQKGGMMEHVAEDVFYRYDRLFAKFRKAVFCIEDVPDLEGFMQTYMPILYGDLLETITYELIENFDAEPYVQQIITSHYTYK